MLYRVTIDRRVTNHDRFIRLVDAETPTDARAIATGLAEMSNMAAPDDMIAGAFDDEFGGWYVNDVEPADPADAGLYRVVDTAN